MGGFTIIPGLIDAHAHLCFDATRQWRRTYDTDGPARMLLRMAANAREMVSAGITTVRDLGAPTQLATELREAAAAGLVAGPSLLIAGAPITTTGGHCYFMGGEADGELEVRKRVREHARAGVDWIKVMATGGNMTRGTNVLAPQFTEAELAAAVEEAHRLGRRVAAHCHGTEGVRRAVAAGIDTLEHCSFQDEGGHHLDADLARAIAAAGSVVSPTVSVGWLRWQDDGRRQQRKAVIRGLLDAGCEFVMSTDCGIPGVPHGAIAHGLSALCEYGEIDRVAALRLATSDAADRLGLPDRGSLDPEKRADFVVLDGDPLEDLNALTHIRAVFVGGRQLAGAPL